MTGPAEHHNQGKIIDRTLNSIFSDYESGMLTVAEKEYYYNLFQPASPSLVQRWARLGYQSFSENSLPLLRRALLKPLRGIRNTTKRKTKKVVDCKFNMLVERLDREGLSRRGYWGAPSVICLSYDIDQKIGYDYLGSIVDLLLSLELKATFNILTNWEYTVDWSKLTEMYESDHFEIGLHGGRHDIALGYRGSKAIQCEIKNALKCIPFKIASYRAPALCMSSSLMADIIFQDFLVDSSMPMTNMYYKSVESCFPYPICNSPVWEFPVTIQDSSLFLDLKLSEDDSFKEMKKIIDDVVLFGGVGVLNLHPYIAVQNKQFHEQVLSYIAHKSEVSVVTQQELYAHLAT